MSPDVSVAAHSETTELEVTGPEGVSIRFGVAAIGDRIVALGFDLTIIVVAILLTLLLVLFAASRAGESELSWFGAFVLMLVFLARNFYFMGFEFAWRGRTPGKRLRRLRVIDARGGALTRESVIVRNLTRDVEIFVPMTLILAGDLVWPGIPGWARLLAAAWVLLFAFMPLFNRNRQRVGDLIAGTTVIRVPRKNLLPDLAEGAAARASETYAFTVAQLSIYGIYELQVLEDILRKVGDGSARPELVSAVSQKIRKKIDWDAPVASDANFLRSFYRALRGHLEQRMLLGKRRRDKSSGES